MNAQNVIALACVALAALVLIRRAVRLFSGESTGCGTGSCGSCPSAKPQVADSFVPLEQLSVRSPSRDEASRSGPRT